jgi:hypothetical protein
MQRANERGGILPVAAAQVNHRAQKTGNHLRAPPSVPLQRQAHAI